ncbi:MAG: hypothetical protein KHZ58_05985 [Hungatella hathewayi]|nr:hypothetical protein [Hungatella hathewayi]
MKRLNKQIVVWVMLAAVAAVSACGGQNTQPAGTTGSTEGTAGIEKTGIMTTAITTAGITTAVEQEAENVMEPEHDRETEEDGAMKMNVHIGNSTFTATLEDNPAVDSLVQMMEDAPVVIEMSDYSGFEKVGSLGTNLPASNSQTTTQSGDIVLYNGNQIVIFYGSNSWSYTRLGKIDDLSGWEEALGSGDVTVTFSVE